MTYDNINDARTIAGNGEGVAPAGSGTPMDMSVGDGPTMRPKDERAGRGAFAPGDTIAKRYVVEKILGEGGMGIVYQCLDRLGGVSVAVKSLPPEVSRNADEMEDIRDNYRLVSDLHHENIAGARTLEVDESTGVYYLVMDLAPGTSLKRWMKRNQQVTTETKLAILRQVAAALDYAHEQKVIHRDVKPENVMVDDEGGVKVLDFGLAAQIHSSQSRTSAVVTSKGGTPGYKSPEQWRGKPQREPADVYSFGVMAYWMFAGALPFDGNDLVVLGHAVLTEPVEPIAGLPAHMNAALAKALAKEPEDRFASCGAVVDALEGRATPQGGGTQVDVAAGPTPGREGAPRPPVGSRDPVRRSFSEGGPRGRMGGPQPVGRRVPKPPQSGGPRSGAAVKGIIAAALLAALAGGGYYGWTKYDEGVKAREAQLAEERARIAKANEERIARLKAENKKVEAEKRRIQAEREKREKELEEERARLKDNEERIARLNAERKKAEAEREKRDKELEEERARLKANEERIARLNAEKAKAEDDKRRIEAEKEKAEADKRRIEAEREKELAEERARLEKALAPKAKVIAKIDGREVSGAKLDDGTKIHTTPISLTLEYGKRYGPYKVSYESGGRRYNGRFDAVIAVWQGQKEFSVGLKEYIERKTGETKILVLPGGERMAMIYIAPRSFVMGSPETEGGRNYDETQHRVKLTKGYWLGKYEVTQRQWESVMGSNPSNYKKEDNPVENVAWEDCQEFIAKIKATVSRQFGGEARLPTEAEWEYACRAGTVGAYAGDLDDMGWHSGNSGNKTQPVGRKRPNAWGFHDMHGNVLEWCNDLYGDYNGDEDDPFGAHSGVDRVLRGGSWRIGPRFCRSASRIRKFSGDRLNHFGFRLCCSAGPREEGEEQ